MEKNQSNLLAEILKKLSENGLLDNLLLVGSWCNLLYENYFKSENYSSSFRTRDVDFFIKKPLRRKTKVDIGELLEGLGFVTELRGPEGFTVFLHDELILEFLVAEKGRGGTNSEYIEELGVKPQSMRYLNMLESNIIEVEYEGSKVQVPHPANFALHKLLISTLRRNEYKSESDLRQGIELLRALIGKGDSELLHSGYSSLPKGWKNLIDKSLQESPDRDLLKLIQGEHL